MSLWKPASQFLLDYKSFILNAYHKHIYTHTSLFKKQENYHVMNICCRADNLYIKFYLILAKAIKYMCILYLICIYIFSFLLMKELKGENKLTA